MKGSPRDAANKSFCPELCYQTLTPLSEASALDPLYNNKVEPGMHESSRNFETLLTFQIFLISCVPYPNRESVFWPNRYGLLRVLVLLPRLSSLRLASKSD